jgi:NAD(P)H-nitrite reductase large subunit
MASSERRLVVVGGGVAGAMAARAARGEYPDADVTLLSAEPVAFYNKIALASVITGTRRERDLNVLAPDWLEDQGVECRWGQRVSAVELDEHVVRLDGGGEVAFDRLILATGARPIRPPVPGIDDPRVLTLWSLADAVALREGARRARRLVVIGGGVLGVELAFELSAAGLDVALVETCDRVMPGLLDEEAAALVSGTLERRGVKVCRGAPVAELASTRGGLRARLATGDALDADVVVLVAGVAPDTDLAARAGLRTRRGIVVDEHLRTSHPDALAAGNCAELGPELRFLWNPARAQGETAGLNAFETRSAYRPAPPSVHAKTLGLPIFACGRSAERAPGDVLLRERADGVYRAVRLDRAGRVVGAICVGDVRGYHALERAIARGDATALAPEALASVASLVEALTPPGEPGDLAQPSWVCQMCGYNAEGEHPPDVCPVCGVGRDQFLVA